MRTAFGVFGALAGVLPRRRPSNSPFRPRFVYLTVPIFIGVGVLLLFVMMWYDEERIKARSKEIRIER